MSLRGDLSTLGKEQHLLSCATNSATPFPPRNLLGLYQPKGSYAQTEAEEEQEGLEDLKNKSKCPPHCPVHNSYIFTQFHSPVQFSSPYGPAN